MMQSSQQNQSAPMPTPTVTMKVDDLNKRLSGVLQRLLNINATLHGLAPEKPTAGGGLKAVSSGLHTFTNEAHELTCEIENTLSLIESGL